MEKLLNSQEVADRLGMSKIWVYKAAESGLLPFYRIGDTIRFDPEEIEEYFRSRKGIRRGDHLVIEQKGGRKP